MSEVVFDSPAMTIERGDHRGRPALVIGDRRDWRRRAELAGTPRALEVYAQESDSSAEHYAVEYLTGGLLLDALLRRQREVIGRHVGQPCPGCGERLAPWTDEPGPRLVCYSCGAMFEPGALATPPATARAPIGAPLPLAVGLSIGRQLAEAVDDSWLVRRELHDYWFSGLGLVAHLSPLGAVRLVDLGLATALAHRPNPQTSGIDQRRLRYMAPELVYGLEPRPETIVWAIGALVYELTCGRHPRAPWSSEFEMLKQLTEGESEPADSVAIDYPARLSRHLESALANAPGERPSLDQLRAELAAVAADRGIDDSPAAVARYLRMLGDPETSYAHWPLEIS